MLRMLSSSLLHDIFFPKASLLFLLDLYLGMAEQTFGIISLFLYVRFFPKSDTKDPDEG
jgi:hypothetical protein